VVVVKTVRNLRVNQKEKDALFWYQRQSGVDNSLCSRRKHCQGPRCNLAEDRWFLGLRCFMQTIIFIDLTSSSTTLSRRRVTDVSRRRLAKG
jgi:hypothetical protein